MDYISEKDISPQTKSEDHFSESFVIGLFSGAIGVSIAALLALVTNIATNNLFDVSIVTLPPTFAIAGIVLSIVISMIAGVMPATKAAKLDPVESLRRD
ncbi:hypothetical protein JHE06_09365 [Carnobacterium sp. CS13]|uniref:ABC transporter permease n=3 Tax=unclassified Carnobacterium TaxID=257487 RepID=UPI0019131519|nr:FtsX-like permease family protein [Carnobacterium sp. CS13]QQP69804.1 hypothetical protein JHE06_09365 [Carnobacterium sp. CS13]